MWCHLQGKLGTKIKLLTNGLLLTSVVDHPLYLSVSHCWHWLLIAHLISDTSCWSPTLFISVLLLTPIVDHPPYLSVSYLWHSLLIIHLISVLPLTPIVDHPPYQCLHLTLIVDLLVSCLWHRLLITHLTYQRLTSDTNCWSPTLLISILPLTPIVDHPPPVTIPCPQRKMDSRKVMVVSSSTHKPVRRWLPLPGCRRHQYVLQFPCHRRQLPTARPTLPRCHPRDPCLRSLVCASPSGLQFNSVDFCHAQCSISLK